MSESFADLYQKEKLGLHDVPFLLGGLGDYLVDCPKSDDLKNYIYVNEGLKKIAKERAMTGFVSTEGLTSNPDFLHFNARSLREFGVRYYEEFRKPEDPNKVFSEKDTPDNAIRTDLELL